MQDPRNYFHNNNLFDYGMLAQHAEHHGVHVNRSERFPGLVLLKYKDEVQWGDKPWTAFVRMSRGLVVDMKNQAVLAHGFDKFFNLGQMPETSYDTLKDQKDFEISEKLDGSCLVSFINPYDKGIYLTTTGSFDSEHGQVGTGLLRNHANYQMICDYAEAGTLIFELINSRFRIVIDYKKKNYPEGLYLIGYRGMNGRLFTYEQIAILATQLGLPCPKTYKYPSLCNLTHKMKDLPMDQEGFVIRYADGLMVKIKGESYLRAHRFVSQLSDKNILQALIDGVEKEMGEVCPDEFRPEILEKIAYFKSRKLDLLNQCYKYFAEAPKENGRKEFALWVQANVKHSLKGCMFQLMDCKPLKDKDLYDIISKTEKPSVETRI